MFVNRLSQQASTRQAQIRTNADKLRSQRAPLYLKYAGETRCQSAHLWISPQTREATAEASGLQRGWRTFEEAHLRAVVVEISPLLTGPEIADMLTDTDILALIARICDGHEITWNNSSMVGTLTDDAEAAKDELDELLNGGPAGRDHPWQGSLQVWDASEWLQDVTVPATATDSDLEAMASGYEAQAVSDGVYLDGDVLAALTYLRSRAFDLECA